MAESRAHFKCCLSTFGIGFFFYTMGVTSAWPFYLSTYPFFLMLAGVLLFGLAFLGNMVDLVCRERLLRAQSCMKLPETYALISLILGAIHFFAAVILLLMEMDSVLRLVVRGFIFPTIIGFILILIGGIQTFVKVRQHRRCAHTTVSQPQTREVYGQTENCNSSLEQAPGNDHRYCPPLSTAMSEWPQTETEARDWQKEYHNPYWKQFSPEYDQRYGPPTSSRSESQTGATYGQNEYHNPNWKQPPAEHNQKYGPPTSIRCETQTSGTHGRNEYCTPHWEQSPEDDQ